MTAYETAHGLRAYKLRARKVHGAFMLTVGTRLGPYEILGALGAGGTPVAAASEQRESSRLGWGWGPSR
jgi:hypothetical protein